MTAGQFQSSFGSTLECSGTALKLLFCTVQQRGQFLAVFGTFGAAFRSVFRSAARHSHSRCRNQSRNGNVGGVAFRNLFRSDHNNMNVPRLTEEEATRVLLLVLVGVGWNTRRFLEAVSIMLANRWFVVRSAGAEIDYGNHFDPCLPDGAARKRYRFTISELRRLRRALRIPEVVVTKAGDKISGLEAIALLCRRLAEPSRLYTVANEFGRSEAATSRLFWHTARLVYRNHKDLIYFNMAVVEARIDEYCRAIRAKGAPLPNCWAFIDGTKQHLCRPSPRVEAPSGENLQKSVFSGHTRTHCFSWQGITTPDGLIVSMYGPVEGRRHDTTLLSMSHVLSLLRSRPDVFEGRLIYGDPAYGCNDLMCCPFNAPAPGSIQQQFNAAMSSVREAVEWAFGRVKTLWSYMDYDKKQKFRQAPVGISFLVATLLTNCHTTLQPRGNQISMYFDMLPPTLEEYLGCK